MVAKKAPFGGVCTSSEVKTPPHRTLASLGFVHPGDMSLERPLNIVCNAIRQQLMNLQ